ncbi:hypothetical protein ABB37_02757 [Leptomonas pyrrhocoris]|uniref:Leucine-rich repeat protein n=1 Tax=Leptomonas pyrrhocoris TaxID=157538 RepID=A0A0M9G660_LEPPY|nr:hypothetical protein ABB37_02757 [Leptomonas pyrrhocoris]KPA83029.1 hypothetical protein ABB37_02757 [Leptomonas pyrrhocoris]|eukprot:XP_015661468.1 hypothetical protein ABB37_02757 [Leptomonas pyrrhocoris]
MFSALVVRDVPVVQARSHASAPAGKNPHCSVCPPRPVSVTDERTTKAAAASLPHSAGAVSAQTRAATRGITDVMDDIFHTYTGVNSWAAFSRIQEEGAGLRQQLQNGAVFEHPAVQPVTSAFLTEWTKKMRALQASRTCAVGASADSPSPVPPKRSTHKRFSRIKKQASGPVEDASSMEKELDVTEADNADGEEAEEDGLLPRWDDMEPTRRCGPSVLRAIRGAVRTYFKALLHLVTLAERFAGRWGHLSPGELKGLHVAMAHEKAAHVPAGFLFSTFTELNVTEERLGNAVGELARCDRMEVLRLNRNPGLTQLRTLPPHCRVVVASGCHLKSFLYPPVLNPTNTPFIYTSLTTLGLAYNQLRDVSFIALLPALTLLDASFNCMTDIDAVVRDVAVHDALAEVTFQGNPISFLDTYRTTVIRGCVRLDRLDRVAITSEERTLSFQKMLFSEHAADAGATMEHVSVEGAAPNQKAGQRAPAIHKLTLPAVVGTEIGNAAHEAVSSGIDQVSRSIKSSVQRRSTTSATSQISLSAAAIEESAQPLPLSAEAALRTTIVAEMELLVLRGLSTLEPVVPAHTIEELLPSSAFVYELAGLGNPAAAAASSQGGSDVLSSPFTTPATSRVLSPLLAPLSAQNSPGSRKVKASTAADIGGGRLGAPLGTRGNTFGATVTSGGKRVAAALPLYEVASRVCIEGCWGGSDGVGAVLGTPETKHEDPADRMSSPANAGVQVEFEVGLATPPLVAPQRNGVRHGANMPLISSASAAKQRRKGASPVCAIAGGGAGGATGAYGNAASGGLSGVRDPFVLSKASPDGTAARHSSLSDTGVYTAQLPLTPNLVTALQQPLLLHVTVEDTFRYVEGPALRAVAEISAPASARGSSANRGGASVNAGRGSRDGSAWPPRHSPATSLSVSPFPEAVVTAVSGPGQRAKEAAAAVDVADEAAVEVQRRRIGIIRLNPFDLFTGSGGEVGGTSLSRAAPNVAGLSSGSPAATNTTTTSGVPLPHSRVLFLHDAAMEVDLLSIREMRHELQQRQRQLQEALLAYNALWEQGVEPAGERKSRGGAVADGPLDAAVPCFSLDGAVTSSGTAATPGQSSPRTGRRTVNSPLAAPSIAPVFVAGTVTPPSKPTSRASRMSMAPQSNLQLLQLHANLKEQQISVVRQAVRIMAVQARLAELERATMCADVRLSIGRGPSPPPSNSADAALDALRYRVEVPLTRKGRPQPPKSHRR